MALHVHLAKHCCFYFLLSMLVEVTSKLKRICETTVYSYILSTMVLL